MLASSNSIALALSIAAVSVGGIVLIIAVVAWARLGRSRPAQTLRILVGGRTRTRRIELDDRTGRTRSELFWGIGSSAFGLALGLILWASNADFSYLFGAVAALTVLALRHNYVVGLLDDKEQARERERRRVDDIREQLVKLQLAFGATDEDADLIFREGAERSLDALQKRMVQVAQRHEAAIELDRETRNAIFQTVFERPTTRGGDRGSRSESSPITLQYVHFLSDNDSLAFRDWQYMFTGIFQYPSRCLVQRLFIYDKDRSSELTDPRTEAMLEFHGLLAAKAGDAAPTTTGGDEDATKSYEGRLVEKDVYRQARDNFSGFQGDERPNDFGIYDGRLVVWWRRGEGTEEPQAHLCTGHTRVDDFLRLFDHCWKLAGCETNTLGLRASWECRRQAEPVTRSLNDAIPMLERVRALTPPILIGEPDVYHLAEAVVDESFVSLDALHMRDNSDLRSTNPSGQSSSSRAQYIERLRDRLEQTDGLRYSRVVHLTERTTDNNEVERVKQESRTLLEGPNSDVEILWCRENPAVMDMLIGDHCAVLSFPSSPARKLTIALVVRNNDRAIGLLRQWYQSCTGAVLRTPDQAVVVRSADDIAKMT